MHDKTFFRVGIKLNYKLNSVSLVGLGSATTVEVGQQKKNDVLLSWSNSQRVNMRTTTPNNVSRAGCRLGIIDISDCLAMILHSAYDTVRKTMPRRVRLPGTTDTLCFVINNPPPRQRGKQGITYLLPQGC